MTTRLQSAFDAPIYGEATFGTESDPRSEKKYVGGIVVDGAKSRDIFNADTAYLQGGTLLGKITTGGLYRPTIVGVLGGAVSSGAGQTSVTITAASAVEIARLISVAGGNVSLKIVGPPSNGGTVAATAVTATAATGTTLTVSSVTLPAITNGSYITLADGSETPLGFLNAMFAQRVTDYSGTSVNTPVAKFCISGDIEVGGVDAFSVINADCVTYLFSLLKGGVPDPLPASLFSTGTSFLGNQGSYRRVTNTRQVAPMTQWGAPPVPVQPMDMSEIPVKLLSSRISLPFDPTVFTNLQSFSGANAQRYAEDVVSYQTGELKRRLMNLVAAAKMSVLTLGKIYADSSGNLLPTSSGASAAFTYDAGIPSANIDTIANLTGVSGAWSTAGTDAVKQITTLKKYALGGSSTIGGSGYPIKYAIYGKNVSGVLRGLTQFTNNVNGNFQKATEAYNTTEIPDGFLGLNWVPGYTHFYQDSSNAYQTILGDNQVIFIPEPTNDWQELLTGTTPIPTQFGTVSSDAGAQLAGTIQHAPGMYSYAWTDPHGLVSQAVGHTFLPVLKVPKAVFVATIA